MPFLPHKPALAATLAIRQFLQPTDKIKPDMKLSEIRTRKNDGKQ